MIVDCAYSTLPIRRADPAIEWEPGAWKANGCGANPFTDIRETEPTK